jgi:hypothetical protein
LPVIDHLRTLHAAQAFMALCKCSSIIGTCSRDNIYYVGLIDEQVTDARVGWQLRLVSVTFDDGLPHAVALCGWDYLVKTIKRAAADS